MIAPFGDLGKWRRAPRMQAIEAAPSGRQKQFIDVDIRSLYWPLHARPWRRPAIDRFRSATALLTR
jgi:hypothetical protein